MMANDILRDVWPEWQIVRAIGHGSFGVVYEAVRRDNQVESRAAIKVISIPQNRSEVDSLSSEGLTNKEAKTYFRGVVNDFVSEIQLMESFKGVQNIVSVEDYKVVEKQNEIGWVIYIRMELLTPFNQYISNKTLSEREVIKLGCDICTALELCAKRNVIHRDIKPENIFINSFGDFKLGDFGIARKLENVTIGLSQKGTYNYMAPEIGRGIRYDATVDLYSLGLVLYRFMNRNRLPFLNDERQILNPNERMAAIRRRMNGEKLPVPCDASPAMAQVILCACAYDSNQRFQSATAMKNALMSVGNHAYDTNTNVLDKTIPIRMVQQQNYGRMIPQQELQQAQLKNIQTAETVKSKKKATVIKILTFVAILLLLIGAAIFAAFQFIDRDSDVNSNSEKSEKRTESSLEKENENKKDSVEDTTEENENQEYKENMIVIADNLAADGNYTEAIQKIDEAITIVGEDAELIQKKQEYIEEQELFVQPAEDEEKEEPEETMQPDDLPDRYAPFYGIWCLASKDEAEAQAVAEALLQRGFPAQVFVTTDWSNLNSEKWYAVTVGTYSSEDEAEIILPSVQAIYSNAYIKYSGEWHGSSVNEDFYTNVPQQDYVQSAYSPFYGIWCHASKDETVAYNAANELSQQGFDAHVFVTTDWSNLNNVKWYVVTAGVYSSKEEANAALPSVQAIYSSAYVKYSGNWQG